MVDVPIDLQTDGETQCFPLYIYDAPEDDAPLIAEVVKVLGQSRE